MGADLRYFCRCKVVGCCLRRQAQNDTCFLQSSVHRRTILQKRAERCRCFFVWIHGETLVTNAAKEINLSSSSRRCAVSCRNNPAAHIDMQHGSPFTARCQPHVKRKLLNGGSFKQCVGMLYFMLYDFFFFFPYTRSSLKFI